MQHCNWGGGKEKEANAYQGFLCNKDGEIWTLLQVSNNLSGIQHTIPNSCFQENQILITRTTEMTKEPVSLALLSLAK